MLIFISDLHFVDGTAGEHNVPTDAFRIFFEDIAGTADWLSRDGRKIEEIKLVFLGDIFDLLRTEMWFDYPESERPWGDNEAKIELNANTIFDAILNKNQTTFDAKVWVYLFALHPSTIIFKRWTMVSLQSMVTNMTNSTMKEAFLMITKIT